VPNQRIPTDLEQRSKEQHHEFDARIHDLRFSSNRGSEGDKKKVKTEHRSAPALQHCPTFYSATQLRSGKTAGQAQTKSPERAAEFAAFTQEGCEFCDPFERDEV
jgi:hypothetical protein